MTVRLFIVAVIPCLLMLVLRDARANWTAPARYAVDFNGTNTHVDVPHSPELNPAGPFTVEAWVLARDYQYPGHMHDVFPANMVIDKREDVGFGRGYGLGLDEGRPFFAVATAEDWDMRAQAPSPLGLNTFHHIAGTWNGDSLRVFLDGVHVGSQWIPGTHVVGAGTAVMGARYSHDAYWWDGQIAELRISDVCRYVGDFVPPHTFDADDETLALWFLDDASGTVATDGSVNGHDGTIQNGTWVHSIQPIYLGGTSDCLDISTGSFPGGRSPWAVRLLPEFQYGMRVTGNASLRPGQDAETLVLHAAGGSESTVLVAEDYDGAFPVDVGEGLDFGMFFVDSDASDNAGVLRVEIEPQSLVDAPVPTSPSMAQRPSIVIRPNPVSGNMTMNLAGAGDASGVMFELFATDGRLIRRLEARGGATGWDLRDASGNRVAAGRYLVRASSRLGSISETIAVIR